MLGPALGQPADHVEDLAVLLVAPLARGAEVSSAMKILDRRTMSDLVKLLVFMVITIVFTSMLVITIGNLTFGSTKEYRAEFTRCDRHREGRRHPLAASRSGP